MAAMEQGGMESAPSSSSEAGDKLKNRSAAVDILKGHLMGVGTWAWGDKKMWGYGGYDKDLNEAAVEGAFRRSLDLGVNLIDTAAMYGKGESERLVGKFIKGLTPEERNNVVVATKYCPLPWHLNPRKTMIKSLKGSLERLGVEKVDLFQIHGSALSTRPIEHLSHGLADAYDAGLTKSVGVSNFNQNEVQRAHKVLTKRNVTLVSNQVEFSLLRMLPDLDGLIASCADLAITILAYSPLGMGRLTGKYSVEKPPPDNRHFGKVPIKDVQPLLEKMRMIGSVHGKTVSQVALNWCICKGTVPIPGAKNAKQAEENAGALGWRLQEEEVEALDQLGYPGKTNWFWQHG